MGKKSITKRWLLNNMGIILMIMMVLEMILIYVVQNITNINVKNILKIFRKKIEWNLWQ